MLHQWDQEDSKDQAWGHKQEVKRGDPKNGIAVHTHVSNEAIDWDGQSQKQCSRVLAEGGDRNHPHQEKWGDHEPG